MANNCKSRDEGPATANACAAGLNTPQRWDSRRESQSVTAFSLGKPRQTSSQPFASEKPHNQSPRRYGTPPSPARSSASQQLASRRVRSKNNSCLRLPHDSIVSASRNWAVFLDGILFNIVAKETPGSVTDGGHSIGFYSLWHFRCFFVAKFQPIINPHRATEIGGQDLLGFVPKRIKALISLH
ncbi:MAG: hypothetical protein RL015_3054 [Verrucomicrobiota bacterium]